MCLAGAGLVACASLADPGSDPVGGGGSDPGQPDSPAPVGQAVSGDTVVGVPGEGLRPVRLRLPAAPGLAPGRVLLAGSKGAALSPTSATLDAQGSVLVEVWTPVLAGSVCDSLVVLSEDAAMTSLGTLHACQEVELELNPRVLLMVPGGRVASHALATPFVSGGMTGAGSLSEVAVRVSWRSLDESVAAVDSAGRISAVAPGTTRIRATAGATREYVTVSVLDPSQPPGEPLVARVTAGPDEGFVTWAPPAVAAPIAVVWARPLGALSWTRYEVPEGQTWRALASETPGTELEVLLAIGDPVSGRVTASRLDTVTVGDGTLCRTMAGKHISDSRVFCWGQDLLTWVAGQGLSADAVHCRGLSLTAAAGDLPNCVWEAGEERLLLLRGLDEQFVDRAHPAGADVRSAYRRQLFGGATPEATIWRPDPAIGRALPQARVGLVQGYQSAVSWSTDESAVGVITWFTPPVPNGAIAIYHEGHGGESTEIGAETISWLLARGWSVVALNMPRISHMRFRDLHATDYNPVWRMLYGMGQVTEWIHRTWAPDRDPVVVAIGRSGGGWSTLLYGALDPRIDATVVASGFEPLTQRLTAEGADIGDWEQTAPSVFGVLDYTDLVRLAATRPLLVTYNRYDGCCFQKTSNDPFVQWLQALPQDGVSLSATVVSAEQAHGLSAEGYVALAGQLDALMTGGQ